MSALAVYDPVERFQELDFYGYDVVGGRGGTVHADAFELRVPVDAVFLAVAALPHEPIHGRGVHHDHAAGLVFDRVRSGVQ